MIFVSSSGVSGSSVSRQTVLYFVELLSSSSEEASALFAACSEKVVRETAVPSARVYRICSSAEAVMSAGLKLPKSPALSSSKQDALLVATVYTASSPAFCRYRSPVTGFSPPKVRVVVCPAAVTVTVASGSEKP